LAWRYLRLGLLLRLLVLLMSNVVAHVTTSHRACDCVMDVVASHPAGHSAFDAAFCFCQSCHCEHGPAEHHQGFHIQLLTFSGRDFELQKLRSSTAATPPGDASDRTIGARRAIIEQAGRALVVLTRDVLVVLTRTALANSTPSIVTSIFAIGTPVLTPILAVLASILASILAVLPSILPPLHARRLSLSI
jgi:hypothetical protein